MSEVLFSKDSSLIKLPVRGFTGSEDSVFGSKGPIYLQWENAKKAAEAHGYKNISETIIPGKGHVPLPGEVLNWFLTIQKNRD